MTPVFSGEGGGCNVFNYCVLSLVKTTQLKYINKTETNRNQRCAVWIMFSVRCIRIKNSPLGQKVAAVEWCSLVGV